MRRRATRGTTSAQQLLDHHTEVDSQRNFLFDFETTPGISYIIESSEGLTSWNGNLAYYGHGGNIRHSLFKLPEPGEVIDSGELASASPVLATVMVTKVMGQPGIVVQWKSIEFPDELLTYHLPTIELHANFPPVFEANFPEHRLFLMLTSRGDGVPQSTQLTGRDSDLAANLFNDFDEINQQVEDQLVRLGNAPPAPPIEGSRKFYRIRPASIDSDGDGIPDHIELQQGTDPFSKDTDRDGVDDNLDANPTENDAIADPDGVGLPPSLSDDLLARWDFERIEQSQIMDRAESNNLQVINEPQAISQLGMISKAYHCKQGFLRTSPQFLLEPDIPHSRQVRHKYSISLWLKFGKNQISQLPAGQQLSIFSFGKNLRFSNGNAAPTVDTQMYGLSLRKSQNGDEEWATGVYTNSNRVQASPSIYYQTSPFGAIPNSNVQNGAEILWSRPAGSSDKGDRWIHVVIVRDGGSTVSPTFDRTYVYFDGQLMGSGISAPFAFNNGAEWSLPDAQFLFGQSYSDQANNAPANSQLSGFIDRARIYSRALNQSEVLDLYHQDVDNDGLWDISENRSLLWRDRNKDGIRTEDESSYEVNPFYHDRDDLDHDDDGLTSLTEQNIHQTDIFSPDTDGDLMPDGWEVDHGLNPRDDADADLDTDGDLVVNLQEYYHAADPNEQDSDDDGTRDDVEINQGSLPGHSGDSGQITPGDEQLSILLGVGDESGSESENYVLHCYLFDEETGTEQRIYTLQSGGFGQYEERVLNFFNKYEDYSFQIDWVGTNNDSDAGTNDPDGADFDYTLTIEPQGENADLTIIDSYDPQLGTIADSPPIRGKKDDQEQFREVQEKQRVLRLVDRFDLWVDTDMDDQFESRLKNKGRDKDIFGKRDDDEKAEENEKSAIVEVNNDNDDFGITQSPTKDEPDNTNNRADTQTDLDHMVAGSRLGGHKWGKLKLTTGWGKGLEEGAWVLRMRFIPQPGQLIAPENVIRVFDFTKYGESGGQPEEIIGPGKTEANISISHFFDESTRNEKFGSESRVYRMEGLTTGYAVIEAAIFNLETEEVYRSDKVRVTCNVDRLAYAPSQASDFKRDARQMRGVSPHYITYKYTRNPPPPNSDGSVSPVQGRRALRGRMIVRPPSTTGNKVGLRAMSTWDYNNVPRIQMGRGSNTDDVSTSFWVGLEDANTWVQGGILWKHNIGVSHGTPPFAYIETGAREGQGRLRTLSHARYATPSDRADGPDSPGAGGVPPQLSSKPLKNWENEPLVLDFILYKKLSNDDLTGQDSSSAEWRMVFLDARNGVDASSSSNYILLQIGAATPTQSNIPSPPYNDAYDNQKMITIENSFETNQSITFVPGTSTQRAQIIDLQDAVILKSGVLPSSHPENSNDPKLLYQWALSSFAWADVPINSSNLGIYARTGRAFGNGDAEITSTHEWWRAEVLPNGISMWDTRDWGFGDTGD